MALKRGEINSSIISKSPTVVAPPDPALHCEGVGREAGLI